MKPRRLEFCGINSFSERAEIDFVSLLEFGIFGIFGDTGSGKSTILDCIGFALYGSVNRSRTGSIADVINYRAEKAYVHFEFEIMYEGRRRIYRIEREIKRKNAVQTVKVYEKKGETLSALAEGVRESNAFIERIVGLEQKDFEKCIALPQGEFSQFVKAQRSDRLKLVSRLFDLEAYGERLIKKTNGKCAEYAEEYRIAQTRLEPFSHITEEAISSLKIETERLFRQEIVLKQESESLRKQEKELSDLMEKRTAAQNTEKRLLELEEQKEEISALEKELDKLGGAAAVLKAREELITARRLRLEAEEIYKTACERKRNADEQLLLASKWDEEKTDTEIATLTEMRARAQQAELTERKRAETEQKLRKTRMDYVAEAENFKGFSYEEERDALLGSIRAFEEEDLFAFAQQSAQNAFMRTEYAVFANELQSLTVKHPAIGIDSEPLITKYRQLSDGEKKDFKDIKREYDEREAQKKAVNQKLLALEKKNGLYRAHAERLQQLQTEGLRLKNELAELTEQYTALRGMTLAETEKRLSALKQEKIAYTTERSRAQREQASALAVCAASEEKLKAAKTAEDQCKTRLEEAIRRGDFTGEEEAERLTAKYGDPQRGKERVTRFREEYHALLLRIKEFSQTDFSAASEENITALRDLLARKEREHFETVRLLALKQAEFERGKFDLEKKRALEQECNRTKKQADLYERLKKLFEGNKFMDFVAEEYLQNVAQNASGRLLSLTDGRYFLRYEGGQAGFAVGDNFNGGQTRGVYTLSGGETFLVSLSLALALSSEICLKSLRPIEFFFLDEGFGTLDEKLVGTVMDSLEKLKSEHFSIGIISHVEELKHRIDRKLSVEKATEKHGSKIFAE